MTLPCVATGVPEPEYEWFKNGNPLILNSEQIKLNKGTLTISHLTSLDEGWYQCYASNTYGVSMSGMTYLQRAGKSTLSVLVTLIILLIKRDI